MYYFNNKTYPMLNPIFLMFLVYVFLNYYFIYLVFD
jgi:hypothetical protein